MYKKAKILKYFLNYVPMKGIVGRARENWRTTTKGIYNNYKSTEKLTIPK